MGWIGKYEDEIDGFSEDEIQEELIRHWFTVGFHYGMDEQFKQDHPEIGIRFDRDAKSYWNNEVKKYRIKIEKSNK